MNAPTAMNARTTLECATVNGAKALGLSAGVIKPGKLADIILVDLNDISMLPRHDLNSNMVYSARASCVHTTICNGRVLMEGGKVEGEKRILEGFKKAASRLVGG
jgi:5-methylthioadenosine/S-adenosylhomocysteine deaminase